MTVVFASALAVVGGDAAVAMAAVMIGGLVQIGLGLLRAGLLALLEGFQCGLQLLGGQRRLLLGVRVLQALHHGVDVQLLTACGQLGQVVAIVVAEVVAQLALLGRDVLGQGATGHGECRNSDH